MSEAEQGQGKACVIGHIKVRDEVLWADYRRRVPETIAAHGGTILLRGRREAVFAGEHRGSDVVVLEFPTLDSAKAWHASPAYQALVPLRRAAADVDLTLFERA